MARKTEPPARPLTPPQTWWLLASGLAAYLPLAPQVPLWLAGGAALLFLWRALLAWRRQPLPHRWVLILISLAGVAGVLTQYRTLFGQTAGVALLLVFLALKQLEARAARDGIAIVMLAYFLTLTQFFASQSLLIALTMTATLLVTTATLASLTDPLRPPAALLRLAGAMLLQGLPFMFVLFILFPRVSGPLWGLPADAYSSMTGLSDSMAPGAINHLSQSDAIAFRVKFDGPAPERRELYWRGPVLARLVDRTWHPGLRGYGAAPSYRPAAAGPAYDYSVTLEPHNKTWLFGLEFPLQVPDNAVASSDFQLLAKQRVRERLRYALRSRPAVEFAPEDPRVLAEALALPAGSNPRSVALGRDIAAATTVPARRLERVLDFMRAQQLIYTLQPPLTSRHVADEFLFDTRRGFCEHFSAAFAILMRAAGVPTRVVTGYQGGERNPVDDTWVIRQSDAHAWTEVWLPERGWVRIDPTAASAPARIEQNLAAAVPAGDPLPFLAGAGLDWLRAVRYRWWAVSNAWNQWVLGYNPQRQVELLSRLGMDAPDWRKMTAALAVLCGTLLLALAGGLLYRRPRLDPAARLWRKLGRRLARRGLARQDWEGPLDYAQRVAAARPEHGDEIIAISRLYAGLRYGQCTPSRLDELRRRIAAFAP